MARIVKAEIQRVLWVDHATNLNQSALYAVPAEFRNREAGLAIERSLFIGGMQWIREECMLDIRKRVPGVVAKQTKFLEVLSVFRNLMMFWSFEI
jgi:hypothetical protein